MSSNRQDSSAKKHSSRMQVDGYRVVRPSGVEQRRLLDDVIPPKRGPIGSVPGLTMAESLLAGDIMYDEFGYPQYRGQVTGEVSKRPIPHVFLEKEVLPLINLFLEWHPLVLNWILPQIEAPYQALARDSKVGWPGFFRPPNKLEYVSQFIPEILAGDLSRFEASFVVQNIRCQVDANTKERVFQYVSGLDDAIYEELLTPEKKMVRTPIGQRIASRPRLVFNYPTYNLVKQSLDTAIHNVFLKWPAFHHDMFNKRILPVKGYHICLDVKHFERHTAACVRIRAAALGGVYAKCGEISNKIPFVTPTDDWRGARMLYVKRDEGFSEQFGSGDSAVAPSQKEILMCIYASFFHKELGYTREDAINQVALGGDHRLTIRNYGDDNSIDGDRSVCEAFMQYAALFLHVEQEDPPKFLGFVWYPEFGDWKLPVSSYLTKQYNAERAPYTVFRRYPNFGWVEKRKVYMQLGHPDVAGKVFPAEDELMLKFGIPWFQVLQKAEEEKRQAAADALGLLNTKWVMDKEYQMTAEEKMATGLYQGMEPKETRRIIQAMLSKENLKKTNL